MLSPQILQTRALVVQYGLAMPRLSLEPRHFHLQRLDPVLQQTQTASLLIAVHTSLHFPQLILLRPQVLKPSIVFPRRR